MSEATLQARDFDDRPRYKEDIRRLITAATYRGTLLIRHRHPIGPYSRAMPRALRRS